MASNPNYPRSLNCVVVTAVAALDEAFVANANVA